MANTKEEEEEIEHNVTQCDSIPRMTPEVLEKICRERQMWGRPQLNTVLYLNYKGFMRMEGLEDFINVKSLHLDNNMISRIECLDRMTELRTLHLASNRITEIKNLEYNTELRHLDLSCNFIRTVPSLQSMPKLETLNLGSNQIEKLEDLFEIRELPALRNMDASQNLIETVEGVVEFWSELKQIKVLRYHRNPGVRNIEHYRKRLVNALPQLTYLDERPVFPVERKSCKAWEEGGLSAMHEAKKEFARQQHAECGVDPERREMITRRRQLAIERIDREAKEREERERKKQEENPDKDLGTGCKAEDGNREALAQYEETWQKQVEVLGVDGVRAKVAREEGGMSHISKPQLEQRKHETNFDFTPASRAPEAPMEPIVVDERQKKCSVTVSDFRVSASDKGDMIDRQFSVFGGRDGSDLYQTKISSAREGPIIPISWEDSMHDQLAAEAACFEQQERVSRAIAEDRTHTVGGELGGLD